jgi:hypothetical protein
LRSIVIPAKNFIASSETYVAITVMSQPWTGVTISSLNYDARPGPPTSNSNFGNVTALESSCTFACEHGESQMPRASFLRPAAGDGKGADCHLLGSQGIRGTLLRVELSSHGYTLFARSVEAWNLDLCYTNPNLVISRARSLMSSTIHILLCFCCQGARSTSLSRVGEVSRNY